MQQTTEQESTQQATRTTGPLESLKNAWGDIFGRKATPKDKEEDHRSAIEKMRDKVADFDEDYKDLGERLLGGFAQLIGYIGPFLFMAWIGSDLGKFFAPTMDVIPAYGLAYTVEGVIAACTVAMGRSFAEVAGGKANYGKSLGVILIWFILNASSAFGLYLVITNNNHVPKAPLNSTA